jgi:nucleotide-binding universal stress UspA family protein
MAVAAKPVMNRATQHVVVAYDFSPGGVVVLDRAVELACRAPFHCLHVVTVIDSRIGIPAIPPDDEVDFRYAERVQVVVTDTVAAALAAHVVTGPDVHFFVHARIGKPAEEILGLAEDVGADLVMVGSHGLTTLDRLLLGSTAETVAREAKCAVIVARPKTYPAVTLDEVVVDEHEHHRYVPPHRYSYADNRVIKRPLEWPLF